MVISRPSAGFEPEGGKMAAHWSRFCQGPRDGKNWSILTPFPLVS